MPRALFAITLASLFALGCSNPLGGAEPAAPVAPTVNASTADVVLGAVPRYALTTGTLVAPDEADVASEIGGKVARTFVEVGTIVKKGDPLVALDDRTLRYQADEASARRDASEAQVALATTECERAAKLAAIGGVSAAERERADMQCTAASKDLQAANARMSSLTQNVSNAQIRAPFDGVVAERMVSVGEYVTPGRTVARVVAQDPLTLSLSVPEREAGKVKLGQVVHFEVAAFPGETFTATLDRAGPQLRDRTRDRVVESVVPNPEGRLIPGSFAVGRIAVGEVQGLLVPAAAVVQRAGDAHLFAVVDGEIVERIVEVGETVGDKVEIVVGVSAGEKVVSPVIDGVIDGAHLAAK